MISDVLDTVSYRSDPSLNTIQKGFFFAFENIYLTKHLQNVNIQSSNKTNEIILEVIGKLSQRQILPNRLSLKV